MAQSYLESMLGENEKILYSTRQHWFLLFSSILLEIFLIMLFLAATVALAILTPLGWWSIVIGFVLIMIPVVTGGRDVLRWSNHQYVITNRRVIQLSGVFDKRVMDSSLEKVNDVSLTQSVFGRLFDYGDVEILTASEEAVNLFKRIVKPIQFKKAMLNAKARLESGESFVRGDIAVAGGMQALPAMLAQLDELRKTGCPDRRRVPAAENPPAGEKITAAPT